MKTHNTLIRFTLLLVCIFLSACDKTEKPSSDTKTTLSGTVQSYTGGDATLEAHLTIDNLEEGAQVGTGSIKADGSFSLTLNETVADIDFEDHSETCEGATATPTSYKSAGILFLSVVKNGQTVGTLLQASSPTVFKDSSGEIASRFYVRQAVQIIGICQDVGQTTTFAVNMKKGWNIVLTSFGAGTNNTSTVERSNLSWFYEAAQ